MKLAFKQKGQHAFKIDYDKYLTTPSQVQEIDIFYGNPTLNDITQTLNKKKSVRFADDIRSSFSKHEDSSQNYDWFSRSLDESRNFWMEKYREQELFLRKLQETKVLEQKYLDSLN
jgi:hypothetical protein